MGRYKVIHSGTLIIPLAIKLIFSPVMSGCKPASEYEGFSKTRSGIHYRFNVIGEDTEKARPGDYITVDLQYSTPYDSVFFSARRKFRLEEPAFRGAVEECLAMIHVGDEADFMINAHNFFVNTLGVSLPSFFEKPDNIKISARLLEIQSEQCYMKEKEDFLQWIDHFEVYELARLEQFLLEQKLFAEPDGAGLFFIRLQEGAGKRIEPGDRIEVHYEGRFLGGQLFDSTKERDEPFQFVYGETNQVIEGLEIAIGKMHEGETALVILPSRLAFGGKGSSTGMIPPFTSLVYEVEILAVR